MEVLEKGWLEQSVGYTEGGVHAGSLGLRTCRGFRSSPGVVTVTYIIYFNRLPRLTP